MIINNLTDDEKAAIKGLIKKLEDRDQPVRDKQIRLYKSLELYWRHIQDIFWDESVKDFRSMGENGNAQDPYYTDKIINIYRAHGESIIAALSQDIPNTFFPPEDADNPDDIATSKVFTKISEILNNKPSTILELIRCLYLLFNNGTVAAYIYSKKDEKNGTYDVPEYGKKNIYNHFQVCPTCGGDLNSFTNEEPFANEDILICETCEQEVEPLEDIEVEETVTITGYRKEVKPKPCVEYYGMLNVRLPHFVREQSECGYVILETESDLGYAQEIAGDIEISGESDNTKYDRWARLTTSFAWDDISDIVTWRRVWLRNWQLNLIGDKDIRNSIKKKAPKGLYCLLMNDIFIEAGNESLDNCWVISESPISSHIHAEPIGSNLKANQDIRSELLLLQLQSIEYGIPTNFADPAVVDFESLDGSESAVGMLHRVKAMPPGRALGDAFMTLKTATFPKESEEFKLSLDQDAQFTSGDFPTIFGGASQSGSKTLGEYTASQGRALTRLSLTWKLLQVFWSRVTEKRVKLYVNELKEDEKITKKVGQTWSNIWIRKAELTGKIGEVSPDISVGFPITWAQKHDTVLKLLDMSHNNPSIMEIIGHPENAGNMARYIGFPDLYIPGNEYRNKQISEINELLKTEPNFGGIDEMTGQEMPESPSIPVDAELDRHDVEYEVCIAWLSSEAGIDAKENNPIGYLNVKLHAMQHKMILSQQQMAEAQSAQENSNSNNLPNSSN